MVNVAFPAYQPSSQGGLGGELAFRQGVYKSEFVKSVVFASVSLIVIVGPLATFSAIVHRDFETALRLIVGAFGIGTIDGAIGGVLGSIIFRNQMRKGGFSICRIFLHHGRLRAFPAKSGIS
jgi:hypothetical protein